MLDFFKRILFILSSIERRKIKDDRYIEICPVCESENIRLNFTFLTGIAPRQYHCPDCNYTGPLIAEKVVESKQKRDIKLTSTRPP